jgi:uncharacterized SAM-binding protein YcdF (DUF218 family)
MARNPKVQIRLTNKSKPRLINRLTLRGSVIIKLTIVLFMIFEVLIVNPKAIKYRIYNCCKSKTLVRIQSFMFLVSKLFSAITQPMFWLAVWMFLALLLLKRRQKVASVMLWAGMCVWGLLGFTAFPEALLRNLENQYQAPAASSLSSHVGVIVLGGATGRSEVFKAHGQVPLGEAAERMTVPLALMRIDPKLKLVFSGGEGRLVATGTTEAELAKVFYEQQGVDMSRVTLETGARNTRENARLVATILGEKCKQSWLLVTSASHMPRAMAEFESVRCKVIPYPVDFATANSSSWTDYSLANSLMKWQTALHEYLGLAVYSMTSSL